MQFVFLPATKRLINFSNYRVLSDILKIYCSKRRFLYMFIRFQLHKNTHTHIETLGTHTKGVYVEEGWRNGAAAAASTQPAYYFYMVESDFKIYKWKCTHICLEPKSIIVFTRIYFHYIFMNFSHINIFFYSIKI